MLAHELRSANHLLILDNLDSEAASTLADRILEKYHVTKYREEADFQKLLKLLDGFPLALEVILANLAHQAPGEVLAALQAGDVKQYVAAETSYQKILQLVPQLAHLDQKEAQRLQATAHHNLSMVTQEQRQWEQAERYYQQALQLFSEFNDRYSQANTYGQLGILEREREQWAQAREYLLRALEIFADYQDDEKVDATLYHLAFLWQSSQDAELPATIASMLGASREESIETLAGVGPHRR